MSPFRCLQALFSQYEPICKDCEPTGCFIRTECKSNSVAVCKPSQLCLPLIDKVEQATQRVQQGPKRAIHSLAGDLGVNDPVLRQALHARHMLSVGIPKTVAPINPLPSAQEILDILNEADLNRKRTPYQVQLACARGYSRPASKISP